MKKTKEFRIQRVAILGAGIMGLGIAAHFANVGIPTLLLSRKAKEAKTKQAADKITQEKIRAFKKTKPFPFYSKESVKLIEIGNYEDDLAELGEVDWVIETVAENLEIKKELFKKIAPYLSKDVVLTTNTSGISIAAIAKNLPRRLKQKFLGTHFFNPVRYMKLLELIPTSETDRELVDLVSLFAEEVLGKRVVIAKDTPNFIATRIGGFAVAQALQMTVDENYTIEEADALTGEIVGRPKSATFRTADLIGGDTTISVAENSYQALEGSPDREVYRVPDFVYEAKKRGWLGQKTGRGSYQKIKKQDGTSKILMLDYKKMEYVPLEGVTIPALEKARKIKDLKKRLQYIVFANDRAGNFVWQNVSTTLHNAARLIPEVSADIVSVDNAVRWGFNWKLGPFEIWDAIGVKKLVKRMKKEGQEIPPIVESLLAEGYDSFYRYDHGVKKYFDLSTKRYLPVAVDPRTISLAAEKETGKIIKSNSDASLIDLGDNVACLEFHTKVNIITQKVMELTRDSIELVERDWKGLVIGNDGEHFGAGFNLKMVLDYFGKSKSWDLFDRMVGNFQDLNQLIRFSKKPVVAAVHGMTLGGGYEIALACDRIYAAAESYIGLPELVVGLVPAGGGCKEMLRRLHLAVPDIPEADLYPFVQDLTSKIGTARVATSAAHARELDYLFPGDRVVINRDFLLERAKRAVLALDQAGYEAQKPTEDIRVLGTSAAATLESGIINLQEGGHISEHDYLIASKLINILCGGQISAPARVNERHILDLEREAFLSLLGEKKTIARIEHMLKTGKPLRN